MRGSLGRLIHGSVMWACNKLCKNRMSLLEIAYLWRTNGEARRDKSQMGFVFHERAQH